MGLVASGRTVVEVAESLGIAQSALYRWRRRERVDAGLAPGVTAVESALLGAARRRIGELEDEVKILRRAAAAVEEVVAPKGRFALIAALKVDGVDGQRSCHAFGVSRSGYYEWAARSPSRRAIRHAWLTA